MQVNTAKAVIFICLMNHAWVMAVNFDALYDDYDNTENTSKGSEASEETDPGVRSSTPSVLTSTERKVTSVTVMGRESRRRGQVGRVARERRLKMEDSGKFKIFCQQCYQNYFTLNR